VSCIAPGSASLYQGPRPQTDKASVAFDAVRQETVLLAEVQAGVFETWTWNGSVWTHKHPVNSPDAQLGIVFDDSESRIVGFGTSADLKQPGLQQLPPGETWTWDGTNWTHESPRTSPPARRQASLVYDSKRLRVLMMGGFGRPNESFKEVWSWSDGNWQLTVPAPDFYVSVPAETAYDTQHDEVVRYFFPGGYASDPRIVWLFDGKAWRSLSVGPGDLPDIGALGYDSRLGKMLMFGEQFSPADKYGQGGAATWRWDGMNWTKLCVGGGPARRFYPVMTYDSNRGRLVLLGGYTLPAGNPPLVWPQDVWEFDGRQWIQRA